MNNYNKSQIGLFIVISLIIVLGGIFIINNYFTDKNNEILNSKIQFENTNSKSTYLNKEFFVQCLKIKIYDSINRILIQGNYYKNNTYNQTPIIQNLIYLDFTNKKYSKIKLNKTKTLNYIQNYIENTIPICINKNKNTNFTYLKVNYEKFGNNYNFFVDSDLTINNNNSKQISRVGKFNYRINDFPLNKIFNDYSNISTLIVKMGVNFHNLKKYKNLSLKYKILINKINSKNDSTILIKKKEINKIKYIYYNLIYFNNKKKFNFYFSLKDSTLKK